MYKTKLIHLLISFIATFSGFTLGFSSLFLVSNSSANSQLFISLFVILFSVVLTAQGIFTLFWMLYAWEDPDYAKHHRSPDDLSIPTLSITALIPALNEEKVITDTLKAISAIDYPKQLKETLVLIREEDIDTAKKAREAIRDLPEENIRIISFNSLPKNKPHTLNTGLKEASKDLVGVFDAEDEPHPQLYKIINTVMLRENPDVIQSGVQLINFRSNWFSVFNVAEYYFWYKSGLHFFRRAGNVTPLGGNTVFFKTALLKEINGWDENCLTEDADIGFRLTKQGANVRVLYDERHVTKEETPTDIKGFIRQRSRWHQGFLQILLRDNWRTLPTFRQKVVALYILMSQFLQVLLALFMPFTLWIALTLKLPVLVSMLSFLPLYIIGLQIATTIVGVFEFTRAYRMKFPVWYPIKIVLLYFPYQLMLLFSSIRAASNQLLGHVNWEKTKHINAHRSIHTSQKLKPIPHVQ